MPLANEVLCPKCGAFMRKREGKRGPFWGCTKYPTCRYIVDASQVEEPERPSRLSEEPSRFVVLDTETTGTESTSRIVDIGALLVVGDDVVDELSVLIDPGVPIPEEATAVHGITDQMVLEQGIEPAAALRSLLGMIVSDGVPCPILGHNVVYDLSRVSYELSLAGLPSPRAPGFCTLEVARECWPRMENHKLSTLVAALGLRDRGAHRALADTLMDLDVWKMAKRHWHGLGFLTLDPAAIL